jgi:hypothetical protein
MHSNYSHANTSYSSSHESRPLVVGLVVDIGSARQQKFQNLYVACVTSKEIIDINIQYFKAAYTVYNNTSAYTCIYIGSAHVF